MSPTPTYVVLDLHLAHGTHLMMLLLICCCVDQLFYLVLERILVKATPKPPDMTRDWLKTVFACFYWSEEFTVGKPRPCSCTMSFKKASHTVEILDGIKVFRDTLDKTARRARVAAKRRRDRRRARRQANGRSESRMRDVVDLATERRRKTAFKLHANIVEAVLGFFHDVAEEEEAASSPQRRASADAEDAHNRSMAHLSVDERRKFRASMRRLEIYEQTVGRHPTLFDDEQRQARMKRESFGYGGAVLDAETLQPGTELQSSTKDKRRRSWHLTSSTRDALADMIQDVRSW